jgi:hypothetical protein
MIHSPIANDTVLIKLDLLKEYSMSVNFCDEGGKTLHPPGTMFVVGGSDLWVGVFDFNAGEKLNATRDIMDPFDARGTLPMEACMLLDPKMVPYHGCGNGPKCELVG